MHPWLGCVLVELCLGCGLQGGLEQSLSLIIKGLRLVYTK